MCANCGCADRTEVTLTNLQTGQHVHLDADGHERVHEHGQGHEHAHVHEHRTLIRLEHDVLSKNDRLAEKIAAGWTVATSGPST